MKINQYTFIFFGITAALFGACNNSNQESNAMNIQKVRNIDLKDFFKNPEKTAYQISPQGNYISYMAPSKNRLNVFVRPIDSGEAMQITFVDDRDIAAYMWASESRILYMKDNGGDENFALYGIDLDGKNEQALTAFEGVQTQLLDELEEVEDEILVALNKRDARIFDPYRLNIKTGELQLVYENPGNVSSWLTDHNGKLRIAITTDGVNTSVLYRETEADKFEPIITTSFKESMSPMFFTFDNKNLFALSNVGRDKLAFVKFDVNKKEEIELIFEHPDVDLDNVSFSKVRKELSSISYTTDKRHRKYLSKETEEMMLQIESQLVNYEIGISASTKDETRFIVRSYSDRSMGAYYIYDKRSKELNKIDEISPWINEEEMAATKPISYQSRDGLSIHGYLTLPLGVEAKNLPVVVNPHGGPWARDTWGFNPEVQFLANIGYAVLQMNFRGSTGYGKSFMEASFKQWGQKMQDDISDGVHWLVENEIADPNRVAIYGASYGGYATLAGLAFTPELYACGVDYVGVSNLFSFMETIPPYWEQYLDMMYEMVGHPQKDSVMMKNYSPSLNANKIKAPLFIAQGANDPRVKKSESDQMVEALQKQGVDVEYMVKTNEGHGFGNEENKFDFYQAMERFLAEHLAEKAAS